MTNPHDALAATTQALLEASARRLVEAQAIKSPAELGITADRSKRRSRAPRKTRRRTIR